MRAWRSLVVLVVLAGLGYTSLNTLVGTRGRKKTVEVVEEERPIPSVGAGDVFPGEEISGQVRDGEESAKVIYIPKDLDNHIKEDNKEGVKGTGIVEGNSNDEIKMAEDVNVTEGDQGAASYEPIFVLVVSSLPRSGSTLMAEVLSQLESSVLFFEPLWIQQGSDCIESPACIANYLRQILECKYDDDFETWFRSKRVFLHFYNEEVRDCLDGPREEVKACTAGLDLRAMCTQAQVRVMKVIRTKLDAVTHLLNDSTFNLKVIYLTRDPRGSLNSIRRFKWNKDPKYRCTNLDNDIKTYRQLKSSYPSSIMHVKHEDFCLQPQHVMSQIHQFITGVPTIPGPVKEYLDQHMTETKGSRTMSTFKDSQQEYQAWRSKIPESLLKAAEEEETCAAAISAMGHMFFGSSDRARDLSLPLILPNPS